MNMLNVKKRAGRIFRFAFLICLVGLLQGCRCFCTSKPQSSYDFSIVDKKVQSWVGKCYYPGAGLVVTKDNQVIHQVCFGDYTPETEVYIASAGKWLAAATIAAIVEEGKLSWDDPVSKWLPEFTDVKGSATLIQLLSHTSGYPDYHKPPHERDTYQTLGKSVQEILPLEAAFQPGERFQYGGLAMQVAGRMAELAGGMDWESLFQSKIARPLNMKNTHFTPVNLEPGHAPMLGGGARTTLEDYANFISMISNDGMFQGRRILSEKSIAYMEADHVGSARVERGEFVERVRGKTHRGIYGLGEWREELNEQGQAVLISSPSWAGAYPWIDKTNNVYGFFLTHIDVSAANGFSGFYASPILATMVRQSLEAKSSDCKISVQKGFVNVDDADLYYEMAGEGTPIILIHGHSLDRRMWDDQFYELAKTYRVIRYDLRGYGLSDVPRPGQHFMHVEDLKCLMDALKIEKAHLVGLSLGGFIVVDSLALYPERMLSGTAASGTLFNVPGPDRPMTEAEKEKRYKEIAELRKKGIDTFKAEWIGGLLRSAGRHADAIYPSLSTMINDWTAWQPLNIEPRLLLGASVLEKLKARPITIPMLVIVGENESKGGFDAAEQFMTLVPQAKKIVLKGAGHMCNMEVPEEFNRYLLTFLAKVDNVELKRKSDYE